MNPYQPPQTPYQPPGSLASAGTCPRCRAADIYQPRFTWWGGVLGPKVLNHWQCRACSFGFNPKTGNSTTGAIAIYFVVVSVIAFVLIFFVMRM
jgi:rubredoxin